LSDKKCYRINSYKFIKSFEIRVALEGSSGVLLGLRILLGPLQGSMGVLLGSGIVFGPLEGSSSGLLYLGIVLGPLEGSKPRIHEFDNWHGSKKYILFQYCPVNNL
jgi:hypothetical protein